MGTSEFICIAYSGEKVNTGEMDINDLAPALLAFSDLIGECNKILNQDNSQVQVKIKADFQQGSFEVVLDIVRSMSKQFMALFQPNSTEIGEILNLIGIGASISGINLIELLRWARGRKISKVTNLNKDAVNIEIENEEREVSIATFKLFTSRKIRKSIAGVLSPLNKEGIDAFEVRDKKSHSTIQKISKDEQDYFCADIDADIQEIVSTKTSLVHIVSINFEEGLKWRFDDGNAKFYANIKDEEFIKNVQASNISFKKGDILKVEITTTQRTDGQSIKTTFDITKVEKIINNEQIALQFGVEAT